MMIPASRWSSSAALCLALALPSFAQLASNTSIVGNVADGSGASIGGAQITARNQGTGESFSATSNDSGNYEFQFLKAGAYTVTVLKTGFSTAATKSPTATSPDASSHHHPAVSPESDMAGSKSDECNDMSKSS